ncbi:MAG: arylesterase [Gallionellaceae bacterium]|jgi:acyl-CoA thioesterase-1
MKTFQKIYLLLFSLFLPQLGFADDTILVFGDSLSAGYGIERESGWVNLLQKKLQQDKQKYQVINASISGETTAGGLRRFKKALNEHRPAIVIIELGANDGLRGHAPGETEKNLASMIIQAKESKAKVLLLGMRLPPNYGADYTRKFAGIFSKLAAKHKVSLVPFMLKDIPDAQFQTDNLHPNAAAQNKILLNIIKELYSIL